MNTIAENPPPVGSKIHVFGDSDFNPALAYEVARDDSGDLALWVCDIPCTPRVPAQPGIDKNLLFVHYTAAWTPAEDTPSAPPVVALTREQVAALETFMAAVAENIVSTALRRGDGLYTDADLRRARKALLASIGLED